MKAIHGLLAIALAGCDTDGGTLEVSRATTDQLIEHIIRLRQESDAMASDLSVALAELKSRVSGSLVDDLSRRMALRSSQLGPTMWLTGRVVGWCNSVLIGEQPLCPAEKLVRAQDGLLAHVQSSDMGLWLTALQAYADSWGLDRPPQVVQIIRQRICELLGSAVEDDRAIAAMIAMRLGESDDGVLDGLSRMLSDQRGQQERRLGLLALGQVGTRNGMAVTNMIALTYADIDLQADACQALGGAEDSCSLVAKRLLDIASSATANAETRCAAMISAARVISTVDNANAYVDRLLSPNVGREIPPELWRQWVGGLGRVGSLVDSVERRGAVADVLFQELESSSGSDELVVGAAIVRLYCTHELTAVPDDIIAMLLEALNIMGGSASGVGDLWVRATEADMDICEPVLDSLVELGQVRPSWVDRGQLSRVLKRFQTSKSWSVRSWAKDHLRCLGR